MRLHFDLTELQRRNFVGDFADWRQNKDTVKAAGFSLRKHHDEWSVGYWSDDEDCPLPPAR